MMNPTLHITSGDCAGALLAKSGVPGEVFVWHDILYDGPRNTGWPDDDTLNARARFLSGLKVCSSHRLQAPDPRRLMLKRFS